MSCLYSVNGGCLARDGLKRRSHPLTYSSFGVVRLSVGLVESFVRATSGAVPSMVEKIYFSPHFPSFFLLFPIIAYCKLQEHSTQVSNFLTSILLDRKSQHVLQILTACSRSTGKHLRGPGTLCNKVRSTLLNLTNGLLTFLGLKCPST